MLRANEVNLVERDLGSVGRGRDWRGTTLNRVLYDLKLSVLGGVHLFRNIKIDNFVSVPPQ